MYVCVCDRSDWGLPLCQNSSVTLGNDQSSPRTPYHTTSQLDRNCSAMQSTLHMPRTGSHTHTQTYPYYAACYSSSAFCHSLGYFFTLACISPLNRLLLFPALSLMYWLSLSPPQLTGLFLRVWLFYFFLSVSLSCIVLFILYSYSPWFVVSLWDFSLSLFAFVFANIQSFSLKMYPLQFKCFAAEVLFFSLLVVKLFKMILLLSLISTLENICIYPIKRILI